MIESVVILPMGFFDGVFFTNVNFFLILMITLLGGFIGATSGYASIGAFGAFLLFVRVATEVNLWIFQGLLYVFLTIVMIGMGAMLWGFIGSAGDME